MNFALFGQASLALFTIINPIGMIPLYLSMVARQPPRERRGTATSAAFAVMVTLIVSLFLGRAILSLFDIQLAAFTLAGESVIATIAWSMLNVTPTPLRSTPEEHTDAAGQQAIAIVPLAIPMLAGPGAISTVITFANRATLVQDVTIVAAIATVAVLTAVVLLFAPSIQRLLGQTGMNVLTRIFGLLLLAVAVSGATRALAALFPGLVHL